MICLLGVFVLFTSDFTVENARKPLKVLSSVPDHKEVMMGFMGKICVLNMLSFRHVS